MTIDKDSLKLGIAIANFRSFLTRFYDDSECESEKEVLNVSLDVFDKIFEAYRFVYTEDADCDKD